MGEANSNMNNVDLYKLTVACMLLARDAWLHVNLDLFLHLLRADQIDDFSSIERFWKPIALIYEVAPKLA